MAPQHSMIRPEGARPADAHDVARTAGRAVALVAALRRLRRRRLIDRNGDRRDVVTTQQLARHNNEPPEKG